MALKLEKSIWCPKSEISYGIEVESLGRCLHGLSASRAVSYSQELRPAKLPERVAPAERVWSFGLWPYGSK